MNFNKFTKKIAFLTLIAVNTSFASDKIDLPFQDELQASNSNKFHIDRYVPSNIKTIDKIREFPLLSFLYDERLQDGYNGTHITHIIYEARRFERSEEARLEARANNIRVFVNPHINYRNIFDGLAEAL